MYFILLLVGAFGFLAMAFLGMSHGFGGHHIGAVSHPKVNIPGAHHGAAPGQAHFQPIASPNAWKLLMALSPIDVFSMLFGAGAVGTLLKLYFMGWHLALIALAGGALFAFAVIRPMMGFLLRFASNPSDGLEGQVSSVGEATTRFDSQGRGVIRLVYDQQETQLLATLESSELEKGVKVAKGEQVVVISVNPKKNSCVVSRELAPAGQ